MIRKDDLPVVQAMSGRILATLNTDEIALLHLYYEQGRKVGVKINISYPGFDSADLPRQFRSVLRGETAAPIWLENSVISVCTEST